MLGYFWLIQQTIMLTFLFASYKIFLVRVFCALACCTLGNCPLCPPQLHHCCDRHCSCQFAITACWNILLSLFSANSRRYVSTRCGKKSAREMSLLFVSRQLLQRFYRRNLPVCICFSYFVLIVVVLYHVFVA